jgi:exodeoxyribonuclease VII large subunit
MFRSEAKKVLFDLKDGLQVICKGRINVYEPRGQYQLVVEIVEPKGKGALQLAFEQLKEKLNKEGLFDSKFKKKLPLLPKVIGVVTSPRGAAIVDIIRTLERRFNRLHILVFPVKVQGEGAAHEIAEAIDYLGELSNIDVIIVGRGGGSIEDLWAFNEERVARSIFHCPVPLISAVGHEIDYTIADFVADIRASTPSIAAEMVIEKEHSFLEKIDSFEKQITSLEKYFLQEQKSEVFRISHHKIFQDFRVRLLNLEQKVDGLETRAWDVIKKELRKIQERRSQVILFEEKIKSNIKRTIQFLSGKWEKLTSELHNLSPLNILKKGYTLTWKDEGRQLIRRIQDVKIDEKVIVSFFKGDFTCLVKGIDPDKLIESRIKKEK